MRLSKMERQDKILDIILTQQIATQEELVGALKLAGVECTQATVSRDIKELNLVKVTMADGRQKYVSMIRDQDMMQDRVIKVFTQAAQSCETADNLVVIQTLTGMAQAAATAIDAMNLPGIVGSLAGDDTIFVATRSAAAAERLREALTPLIHRPH